MQKTAYEMRISDWSSDVCSSDLMRSLLRLPRWVSFSLSSVAQFSRFPPSLSLFFLKIYHYLPPGPNDRNCCDIILPTPPHPEQNSAKSRVGKACVSTCRSRWWTNHLKKKHKTNTIISTST